MHEVTATKLTVLLLLPVSRWFLESFDHERGSTGHHFYLRLSVLDSQLDRYFQPLPVLSCLRNVITDLLGRLKMNTHKNCL